MGPNSAFNSKDLRRHRRYKVDSGILQVSWLDSSGRMKTARTRALNISETGIALELPEAAMPLLVRFQSERFKVKGVGAVRYCRRTGGKYVVGLEFTNDLHWRAPDGEVMEPISLCDPESGW
jgi:hypothetical protein